METRSDLHQSDMPEYALTGDMIPALFALGDLMPGGLFLYKAEEPLELIYANRATLRIFGCDTLEQFKELTGYTFRGLVHPEDFEHIQDSITSQITEYSTVDEKLDYVQYRITRRDGTERWITDYGRLVYVPEYGNVYIVFIADATERRRAREEQRRMELALAHEKQSNEIKSNFLFNMSHDIRTPMNAIIGFSELARRHLDEPEKVESYLDKTVASGHQLLRLIDDMLDLNELKGGQVELRSEPTDLREQIGLVLDLFRIPAEEKQITLTEEITLPEERVLIDQGRFRRVLSNLISNAVKFTPAGGSVTVTARQRHRSESGYARYRFTVSDTGVGIAEDFMPRMYEAFEREQSSTVSGKKGTGLGLTIVRTLTNLMGGTVSAVSEKGKGSAFTVELPLALAEQHEEKTVRASVSQPAVKGDQARILVAEDIELNRELLVTLLEEYGFLVEAVPDGCDALDAVANHAPDYYDLILMDIQMPVMNGYEATRAIRALPREDTARLPIIALSANAREEDRRESLERGMNNHIAKPIDIEYLTQTIRRTIADQRERNTEKA